jgi:hypothetical protein
MRITRKSAMPAWPAVGVAASAVLVVASAGFSAIAQAYCFFKKGAKSQSSRSPILASSMSAGGFSARLRRLTITYQGIIFNSQRHGVHSCNQPAERYSTDTT